MDQEGDDRGRDRPDRQLERRQLIAVGRQGLLDQDDRADRDEDVLAEEQADIVGGSRIALHLFGGFLLELAMLLLGRGQRHRRDQRPHRLGMAGNRREAERSRHLPEEQVDDQQAADRRRPDPGHHRCRALLQSVALEQPDDGKHDPDDSDDPIVVERLAEGGDHLGEPHAAEQTGGQRRHGNDEHRIEPKQETDDDDQDARKREILLHHRSVRAEPPPIAPAAPRRPIRFSSGPIHKARHRACRSGRAGRPPAIGAKKRASRKTVYEGMILYRCRFLCDDWRRNDSPGSEP
jgi:hypothetical protein